MATFLLVTALLAGPAREVQFTKFTYEDFDRGGLYTSTVTFRRGQVEVDLVGVVHIADRRYYQEIQRQLESYDKVFYKLVSGASPEDLGGLSALQAAAGKILGLSFQLSEIEYGAANFVHSDFSWREIQEALGTFPAPSAGGKELLERFLPELKRQQRKAGSFMGENPEVRRSMKVFLGQLLGDLPALLSEVRPESGQPERFDILISGRNRRAMKVLKSYLTSFKEGGKVPSGKKRLALFWGAGHMPDFARRLVKAGFKAVSTRWHLAWKIGDVPEQRWF